MHIYIECILRPSVHLAGSKALSTLHVQPFDAAAYLSLVFRNLKDFKF